MRQPIIHRTKINGKEFALCSESRAHVAEYVFWRAGQPLKSGEALAAVRQYLPKLSHPNFSDLLRELGEAGTLVKLQHGWYIHKDVLALFS